MNYNDYPLALGNVEMFPSYQLKITDFYNFAIGPVKNVVLDFFHKEK